MNDNLENLHSLRDMVRWGASQFSGAKLFFGHGTDNALDEALAVVLHVLHLDYSLPGEYLDCRLTDAEKFAIKSMISERMTTRKPLAYLTGTAMFAGLEFAVNEHVLVPRSPIAELLINGYYPWVEPDNVHSMLDLCTGSGCIGLASAVYMPQTKVVVSDISDQAIVLAKKNVESLQLQEQVAVIKSDVYQRIPAQKFDLIVSNPPYVSEEEYQQLPLEYHREPKLGLTADHNGMQIVEKILTRASDFLTENGVIIVEVGASADLLMRRYPQIEFNWIEFEHGGDGVFVMSKDELDAHCDDLKI